MSISKAEKAVHPKRAPLQPSPKTRLAALCSTFAPSRSRPASHPSPTAAARLLLGDGTEVLAATKLQVDDDPSVTCTVTCSPSAYPHLSPPCHRGHPCRPHRAPPQHALPAPAPEPHHPSPARRRGPSTSTCSSCPTPGTSTDALFMAARAALCDTKVPRTRGVEYKARKDSGFDTRTAPTDFELSDYWDEGEVLAGSDTWPVCITLNIESPSVHYLDAILQEEASTPLRLLLIYSFPGPTLQGMRTLGSGELTLPQIKALLADGGKYAQEIMLALNAKLKEEDLRRNQKARDRFEQRF
ncbi:hypothetical protein EV421DRAFT_986594 [Armillaria borealis]|uniref:Uncharacterized protein n=1 Tax=Armillaria borealis TaxID=47425 RepID=A0AA39J9U0_9AGAR|nr:hypothetical protein EV421DRAFT_986594 [Armillaria borealis]